MDELLDYSVTQLTQAMNTLPNMYQRVGTANIFGAQPLTTNSVRIENQNGTLALVPTTPWGGVAPKNTMGKRASRTFTIPHMPLEDLVLASEVMGVRAFGTQNQLETVAGRINDKLQTMKNKIDMTIEFRKVGALQGLLLDIDPATGNVVTLENYFDAFGVTKKTVNFGLSNTATDVRAKCMEVVRWIEDNLLGEASTGVHALVSPEFFDALINHKSVKEAFLNWTGAQNQLGGDLRKGFTWGGITFEEYNPKVGNTRFIAANSGTAYPEGTQSTFANYLAPADFAETVNTVALPYYARQQNKDFNRGIDLHVQANQMPIVQKPGVIVELIAG